MRKQKHSCSPTYPLESVLHQRVRFFGKENIILHKNLREIQECKGRRNEMGIVSF